MDVNFAVYVLQLSSTQKWKNRHLKQCRSKIVLSILGPTQMQLFLGDFFIFFLAIVPWSKRTIKRHFWKKNFKSSFWKNKIVFFEFLKTDFDLFWRYLPSVRLFKIADCLLPRKFGISFLNWPFTASFYFRLFNTAFWNS